MSPNAIPPRCGWVHMIEYGEPEQHASSRIGQRRIDRSCSITLPKGSLRGGPYDCDPIWRHTLVKYL